MPALKYWVWLAQRRGLGNQARLALLRHFGSPEAVYYADREEVLLTGAVNREQAQALNQRSLEECERILEDCQRLGLRILTIQDADYPGRLQNIYDPPCLLYVKGRLPAMDDEAAVAVVGTRKCTPYGVACAEKLGYGLAGGGAVVVSGLAKGIDAAASRGALRAGGRTVGVVGNGLDVTYPRESRYLYEDIPASGALISEYPPGTEPAAGHFPARNRILSGLSLGTLVVEAPLRSGALITAETALEQGRDLFAVPGPIDAPNSDGCNRLIHDGAVLVMDAWDVLDEYTGRFPDKLKEREAKRQPAAMGYEARQRTEAKAVPPTLDAVENGLTDDQITLLRVLPEGEPMLVDDLIDAAGIPTRRVLSALTLLEMEQWVCQHSGKRYTRTVTLRESSE